MVALASRMVHLSDSITNYKKLGEGLMKNDTIPGPRGHWLFRSLFDYFRDPPRFLMQMRQEYGDIAHFKFFIKDAYVIFDPQLIGEVYITQNSKFIKNRLFWNSVKEIFGKGLLTNEGDSWKKQRKIAAPSFQPKNIANYFNFMVELTDEMLGQWQPGDTIKAHEEMMLLTADIVAKALFDSTTKGRGQKLLEAIIEIEHMIPRRVSRPHPIIHRLPLPSNRRYKQLVNIIEQEILSFIDEHDSVDHERNTLLKHLMDATYEDGSKMSRKQLRDEVINVFLAGHDTTAITLSWSFYALSKHPEIQRKLVKELRDVLGASLPTMEKFKDLKYTRQVILESLRLYPAAYVMGRESTEDVQLGNHRIPKGAAVLISPYVMHRMPEYFDEPEAFKPERWTEEFKKALPKHVYIAFGGGPRVCIGEHFSMMEAVIILAMVYQRFSLKYEGEDPPEYFASVTLPPKHGMPVQLIPQG